MGTILVNVFESKQICKLVLFAIVYNKILFSNLFTAGISGCNLQMFEL